MQKRPKIVVKPEISARKQFSSFSSSRKTLEISKELKIDSFLFKILRPHQVTGIEFMFNSILANSGCILADEMYNFLKVLGEWERPYKSLLFSGNYSKETTEQLRN